MRRRSSGGRKLAVLVVFGVLAAWMPLQVAATESSPSAAGIDIPIPEVTGPGRPTPPATEPVELVDKRDAYSKTFVLPDGNLQSTFAVAPVHFRDEAGEWQAIDDSLVRSGEGWTNRANSFDATVPERASEPVSLVDGEHRVSFRLDQAADVAPVVEQSTARFDEVQPGVAAEYQVIPTGIKESVVLEGPTSPSTFAFTVSLSEGLSLRAVPGGGAVVLDAAGEEVFTFSAPFAEDAARQEGPATMTVVPAPGGARLSLAADPAWLANPARRWPVVIDPTVTLSGTGSITDCYGSEANPTGNACSAGEIKAGWETNRRQSWLRFPDVSPVVGYDSVVTEARLQLHAWYSSTSNAIALQANSITEDWDSNATWNKRNATTNWTTAGGHYTPVQDRHKGAGMVTIASNPGVVQFFPTQLVSDMVTGDVGSYGMIIRPASAANNTIHFRSSEYSDATKRPELRVTYQRRLGLRSAYTFDTRKLTDRSSFSVNVANGAYVVSNNDLTVRGTGLNLSVQRFYNNMNPDNGWTWSVGADVRLVLSPDGSATYVSADGAQYPFIKSDTGTWRAPPGINAKLIEVGLGVWRLTFNQSREKLEFYTIGSGPVLKNQIDRNGNDLVASYNNVGGQAQISSIVDTQNRNTTFTWTSGRITKVTDSEGRHADYTWSGNKLTQASDLMGKTTTYGYDTDGRLDEIITPRGNKVRPRYGGSALPLRELRMIHDLATSASYDTEYDYDQGLLPDAGSTEVTDARGKVTTYNWNRRNLVTKVTDANGNTRDRTYTPNDDAQTRTDGLAAVTTSTYDSNSNLTNTQSPASASGQTAASSTLSYQAPGDAYAASSRTDSAGNCSSFLYDGRGNVTTVHSGLIASGSGSSRQCNGSTSPDKVEAAYSSSNGTLAYVTDAKGNVTDYDYDSLGNLITIDHPSPLATETITNDPLSRVKTVTDGLGQATRRTYDDLDRVTRITFDGDTSCTSVTTCINYTYDDDGNLLTRVDVTGTTTFGYDRLNRPTIKVLPGGANACSGSYAMFLTYDGVGNVTSHCDTRGTINYTYDDANQLVGLAQPGGSCTSPKSDCVEFEYDDNGRRVSTKYPTSTAVTQTVEYWPGGPIKKIEAKRGSTVLTSFSYTYNMSGADTDLRRSMVNNVTSTTTTYGYDKLNRLELAQTGSSYLSYDYDRNGNRTTLNNNGTITSYAYNAANQLCWTYTSGSGSSNPCGTPPSGAATYSFNTNGDQTSSSAGFAASYNPLGQTTASTPPGGSSTSFGYRDSDQDERSSIGSSALGDSFFGLAVLEAGGNKKWWTRDPGGTLVSQYRTATSATHYYLFDGLGSVVGLVNDSGTLTDTYSYDPYGKPTSVSGSSANPWRYVSGYHDNDYSTKFGSRYYNPQLGRWTQRDAFAGAIAEPRTVNRYAYAGNDPINSSDPSGYFCPFGTYGGDGGGCRGGSIDDNPRSLVAQGAAAVLATPFVAGVCIATVAVGCAAAFGVAHAATSAVGYATTTCQADRSFGGYARYTLNPVNRYTFPTDPQC